MSAPTCLGRRMLGVSKWAGAFVCAALVTIWLISGWHRLRWDIVQSDFHGVHSVGFEVSKGGLRIHRWIDRQGMTGFPPPWGWQRTRVQDAPGWQLWFGYRDGSSGIHTSWNAFVPLWAPLLVFGPLTYVLWRRSRRFDAALCLCGYPRAGLEEGATCPECGRRKDASRKRRGRREPVQRPGSSSGAKG
ncbi:MAG: hypothetical protein JJU33_11765 [Phycisphaerales bacterium]|nr:hypothetical protein [Phycisphaerales bacterium]